MSLYLCSLIFALYKFGKNPIKLTLPLLTVFTREETSNWLLQAEAGLEAAKGNVGIKQYFAASFFSQQAAEKALKAMALEKLR